MPVSDGSIADICRTILIIMPVDTELYDLLEIPHNATEDEIKKAYRKKAKEHHPNINDPDASTRFQEIGTAYEILSDPQTRQIYDEHGLEGLAKGYGGPSGGPDAADLFSEFFAGNGFSFMFDGPRTSRPRRGEDSVIPYDVTLEDLYNGKHVKMNMEKEIVCGVCRGSGARGNAKLKPCIKCDGKGWTITTTPMGHSVYGQSRAICTECQGAGEKLREKDRCKKCKSKKTVKEKKRLEIFIEKGMTDQQRIVLTGEGDQLPDAPAGDVIFVLKLQPHSSFERSGNDLLAKVKITLSEALLGFSRILLTHLDGRGIEVTSPPGKVIQPKDTIVLRGEGMPHYKNQDLKGDLYVIFDVEFPDTNWALSVDKEALERLLPPKRPDLEPRPAVVDAPEFEEADSADFGADDDEEAWTDEDSDDMNHPDCQTQ
ncbi:hypothetical protein ACEPAI_6950 [Sanghuangporus weigelae]